MDANNGSSLDNLLDSLTAQHEQLKSRLRELEKHVSLTTAEQLEYSRLKKLKLRTKDRIYQLQQN